MATPVTAAAAPPAVPTAEERLLLNRAGFGPSAASLELLRSLGWEKYVAHQLKPADKDDPQFLARLSKTRMLIAYEGGDGMAAKKEQRKYTALEKSGSDLWKLLNDKVPGQERERPLLEVRAATALRAVYSQWQLRELLADFWHNHFNIYPWEDDRIRVTFPVYDRDIIRASALGNFRTMLEAVATSVPMLIYLDNFTSKASPANENYARELFELHTMGADAYLNHLYNRWRDVPGAKDGKPEGYIDQDVYEAARAFTGWTIASGEEDNHGNKFPDTGAFHYAAAWHDPYQKRILGTELDANQPPQSDGKKVLDLVAAHPSTAKHICRKLCTRLHSDDPPAALVDRAVKAWQAAAAAPDQIAQTVRAILLAPEMKTGGNSEKVKRPLELAVSFIRATAAEFRPSEDFFNRLEACGQPLFGWLPPTGFPDKSAYWLTSRFMMERWNLLWDLARGELDTGRLDPIAPPTAAGAESPHAIIRYWSSQLLNTPLPEDQQKMLLTKAFPDTPADEGLDPLAREAADGARQAVALLAMTPEFQNR